jgi:hypothetical protein
MYIIYIGLGVIKLPLNIEIYGKKEKNEDNQC